MSDLFASEDLHLESLPLSEARAKALDLLKKSKTKATKLSNLIRDVNMARTSREIQRIMWMTYLSGAGLGTIGSKWQQTHKLAGG